MPLHLIKLSVGTESPDTLRAWQEGVKARTGRVIHTTRMRPTRADEVLDGGSLYWVIRRIIQVRQRIIGLHEGTDEDGRAFCVIELDPALVPVEARAHRPFQGWRYLKPQDAPPDLTAGTSGGAPEAPPPEMAAELRKLGLL